MLVVCTVNWALNIACNAYNTECEGIMLWKKYTAWSCVHLEKLVGAQLVQDFYGTQFITMFTTACPWTHFWAKWIQPTLPYPVAVRSVLIIFTYVCLSCTYGCCPTDFMTKTLFSFRLFYGCSILRPSHSRFVLIIDFSKYQLNSHFFYSSTIYMLHYAPQHVSSSTLLIIRRTNSITTASGIVTLCKQSRSVV